MLLFYLSLVETEEEKSKFEKLYYEYRKLMKYIALNILRDDSLAEDAVQEAFIRLTRHLNNIDEINCHKTKAFIVIIIKSASIDLLRTEAKHKAEALDMLSNIPHSTNMPEDNLPVKELVESINKLPESFRDILELKAYHGFSNKEISDILGISSVAVRKRLERARKALSKLLQEDESFEEKPRPITKTGF